MAESNPTVPPKPPVRPWWQLLISAVCGAAVTLASVSPSGAVKDSATVVAGACEAAGYLPPSPTSDAGFTLPPPPFTTGQ
jgi:hypothetical protein